MTRADILWDPSINETARAAFDPVVFVFELLTHLGDGAFLLVMGVLIYWFGSRDTRRSRVFVIAVGITALSLSAGLKGIIQLPRPELVFSPQGYPGYSFPSAHAMGSAAFYGALAVTMEWGTRRRRYLLAGSVITVVAFSRVVMGLHYLGDVVVGVFLGLLIVAIGVWTQNEGLFEPGSMFLLATGIACVAVLLGSRVFVTLTIGASIGGVIGWHYMKDRPTTDSDVAVLFLGGVSLLALGLLRVLSLWIELSAPDGLYPAIFLGEVIGYAALTTVVLLLPWTAIRIEDHPIVGRLESWIPSLGRQNAGSHAE